MRCMTNYARRQRAASRRSPTPAPLDRAAGEVGDILRCDEFSHEACGRDFTYWIERFGYPAAAGARGRTSPGAAAATAPSRSIFSAWMHSAGHRDNILGPYRGDRHRPAGRRRSTAIAGAHVWTQEFGSHC